MTALLVAIAGWGGAALMVGSYLLLSARRLQSESVAYQAMNVIGAAGFVVNSGYNGALPSASVNVIWMAIGLSALWRLRRSA